MGYARLSLQEIGALGAHYVSRPPDWIRRHVETLTLRSELAGVRRLTIDIVLPAESGASMPWSEGRRLYYVPLTTVAKRPARTNLDFTDEMGKSLPVLNRRENGAITSTALAVAARRLGGGSLSIELRRSLHQVALVPGTDIAEVAMAYAITLLRRELPREALEHPSYARLQQLLIDLSANSIMWVGIIGVPRERRIFKLAYDVVLAQPRIPREQPWTELVTVRTKFGESDYEREHPGDRNERGNVRRLANRVANPLGLSSLDVIINRPYIRDAESYHLQFQAPDGLEARRIRLFARLEDPHGRQVAPIADVQGDSAHLHFSRLRVHTPGDANISLRVGRRGFLSYSLVTASLITAMLAVYAIYHAEVAKRPGIAGAALLIVPALLVTFGLRPGEHPIVARLLSGVRFVVLMCGILSVAAALALIGVRPGGASRDDALRHLAEISGTLTALLFVSWVLALDSVEALRRVARAAWASHATYRWTALGLLALSVGLVYLLPSTSGVGSARRIAGVAGLGILAAMSAWTALFADETSQPGRSRRLANVLSLNAIALLWASVEFSGLLRRPFDWADVRRVLIVGLWIAVFGLLVSEPFWRRDSRQAVADSRVPQQDQVEDARLEMGAED